MTYLRSILLIGRVSVLAQLRRRTSTVLLILLPILLFAAMRTSGRSLGVAALGVGLAWSVAILGAFGVRSNAGLDSRLTLFGFRPSRIFVGRLLSFIVVLVLVALVLAVAAPLVDSGLTTGVLFLGLMTAGVVALSVGMVLGLLLRGELESVLVIIGIFGVPLGLALDSTALKFAPGYGSILYLQNLGDRTDTVFFLHSGSVALCALVIAFVLSTRRGHLLSALR